MREKGNFKITFLNLNSRHYIYLKIVNYNFEKQILISSLPQLKYTIKRKH